MHIINGGVQRKFNKFIFVQRSGNCGQIRLRKPHHCLYMIKLCVIFLSTSRHKMKI
jgi:hypothetical protein